MKKFLTVLLTALMVVTLGVVNVAAEGEETTEEISVAEIVEVGVEQNDAEPLEVEEDNQFDFNPTAITGLFYDGHFQNLVNPGKGHTDYAYQLIGEDGEIHHRGWKDTADEIYAKDAGTYNVAWTKFTHHGWTEPEIIEVTIAPREVEITLGTKSGKIYDGKDVSDEELAGLKWFVTEGEFAWFDHKWADVPTVTIAKAAGSDAGEYELTAEVTVARKERGEDPVDVTDNYAITVVPGKYTIYKAPLQIKTNSPAITNAKTGVAEIIIDNYQELEDKIGDVVFVDEDGNELPYEVITRYTGSAQSNRVAIIDLGAGFRQNIKLSDDTKNYWGKTTVNVFDGWYDATATGLNFTKGSKKDRNITIAVELHKEEETEENKWTPTFYTVDGKELEPSFYEVNENGITLKGDFLKTLDYGDHEFVAHNIWNAQGVAAKSNIHVGHEKKDDTIKIVSTGVE